MNDGIFFVCKYLSGGYFFNSQRQDTRYCKVYRDKPDTTTYTKKRLSNSYLTMPIELCFECQLKVKLFHKLIFNSAH